MRPHVLYHAFNSTGYAYGRRDVSQSSFRYYLQFRLFAVKELRIYFIWLRSDVLWEPPSADLLAWCCGGWRRKPPATRLEIEYHGPIFVSLAGVERQGNTCKCRKWLCKRMLISGNWLQAINLICFRAVHCMPKIPILLQA